MKHISIGLLLVSSISITAFAQTGKATINHFQSSYHNSTSRMESYIYLTNISASSTNVKITLYNKNGEILTDGDNNSVTGLLRADNVSAYSDNSSTYSMQFNLEENNSTRVSINNSSTTDIYGYAVVEWSKSENPGPSLASYSLIGHANSYRVYNGTGYFSVPINNGNPF